MTLRGKALTRGRTDHFNHTSACDLKLWPMSLTFEMIWMMSRWTSVPNLIYIGHISY